MVTAARSGELAASTAAAATAPSNDGDDDGNNNSVDEVEAPSPAPISTSPTLMPSSSSASASASAVVSAAATGNNNSTFYCRFVLLYVCFVLQIGTSAYVVVAGSWYVYNQLQTSECCGILLVDDDDTKRSADFSLGITVAFTVLIGTEFLAILRLLLVLCCCCYGTSSEEEVEEEAESQQPQQDQKQQKKEARYYKIMIVVHYMLFINFLFISINIFTMVTMSVDNRYEKSTYWLVALSIQGLNLISYTINDIVLSSLSSSSRTESSSPNDTPESSTPPPTATATRRRRNRENSTTTRKKPSRVHQWKDCSNYSFVLPLIIVIISLILFNWYYVFEPKGGREELSRNTDADEVVGTCYVMGKGIVDTSTGFTREEDDSSNIQVVYGTNSNGIDYGRVSIIKNVPDGDSTKGSSLGCMICNNNGLPPERDWDVKPSDYWYYYYCPRHYRQSSISQGTYCASSANGGGGDNDDDDAAASTSFCYFD